MKLPIKRKYFDEIKIGKKRIEFRDAHLTLICEETKEQVRVEVIDVSMNNKDDLEFNKFVDEGLLQDQKTIGFHFVISEQEKNRLGWN